MYLLSGLNTTDLPIKDLCHLANTLKFIVNEADVRTKEKS